MLILFIKKKSSNTPELQNFWTLQNCIIDGKWAVHIFIESAINEMIIIKHLSILPFTNEF